MHRSRARGERTELGSRVTVAWLPNRNGRQFGHLERYSIDIKHIIRGEKGSMFGQQQPTAGLFGGTGQTTGQAGFKFGTVNSTAPQGTLNFGSVSQPGK